MSTYNLTKLQSVSDTIGEINEPIIKYIWTPLCLLKVTFLPAPGGGFTIDPILDMPGSGQVPLGNPIRIKNLMLRARVQQLMYEINSSYRSGSKIDDSKYLINFTSDAMCHITSKENGLEYNFPAETASRALPNNIESEQLLVLQSVSNILFDKL